MHRTVVLMKLEVLCNKIKWDCIKKDIANMRAADEYSRNANKVVEVKRTIDNLLDNYQVVITYKYSSDYLDKTMHVYNDDITSIKSKLLDLQKQFNIQLRALKSGEGIKRLSGQFKNGRVDPIKNIESEFKFPDLPQPYILIK